MISLRTVTAPTAEPVTLAELRTHTRVDTSADDPTLAGYLLAARQHLEQIMGRALAVQTLELVLDDFPAGGTIFLPRIPVASITSITYTDANGDSQTVASYILDGGTGRLEPAYGESWPSARGTPGSVVVRFVAGDTDPPVPVKHAILLLASQWNEEREAPPENPAVHALIYNYRHPWF